MAAAVKPVEPAENQFVAELEGKSGRPNHFFRTMAHKPEVLERYVPFYKSVMGPGAVERRLKELIYLAVSYANECPYCTAAHTQTGKRAGITDDELRALQTEQDHSFSDPEKAAIRYARELTRTAEAEDSRDELLEHFKDEQIVEMTLVVALANFTNRFNNGLSLAPEAD